MKLLVLLTLYFSGSETAVGDRFAYRIDNILDEALEEYRTRVTAAGDEIIDMEDPLGIGGYVLTGPKLGNMSTLQRVGPAWLVPLDEEVEVHANFTLDKMHMDCDEIAGPGISAVKPNVPRIDIRDNLITLGAKATLNLASSWINAEGEHILTKYCIPDYRPFIRRLSSAMLVQRDGVTSLDFWTEGLLSQISAELDPLLAAYFEKHFQLCQSLRTKNYKLWKTGGDF